MDRRRGRHERERDGDDFVARSDACRKQRQMQGAGAGVDAHRFPGAAVHGEFLLEGCDFAAQRELAAFKHALNRDSQSRL